jgi:hypothetical protein
MSELNVLPPYRGQINPWDNMSILEQINALGGTAMNSLVSATWPSGSLALFVPFHLQQHMYVAGVYWLNGATANGQVDFGIYDENGNRIYSTGPVLQSGTSALQLQMVAPAPPVHLWAGIYYMGIVASSSTATFRAASNSLSTGTMATVLGMAQAAAAYPLPATPTLISVGQDYIPGIGITSEPQQMQ